MKEKFGLTKQKSSRTLIEDKYQGPSMLANTNMKFAKDQLRKAIVAMNGDLLDEALEDCYAIEGFEDHKSNRILLTWAEKVTIDDFSPDPTSYVTLNSQLSIFLSP